MQYFLFVFLFAITITIYIITDKALAIATSVDELDNLRAHVFTILKARQKYILENYANLESYEFYSLVNKTPNLSERIALEFEFDVDETSENYLNEAQIAINTFNQALDHHHDLLKQHPIITKVFKYVDYYKL